MVCAFVWERVRGARWVVGGRHRWEGRGGVRSVRSSFEQGGLRIRVRSSRSRIEGLCLLTRGACRVNYNIRANERAWNRESLIPIETNDRRGRFRCGLARLSRCYRRGSPRIEGDPPRWRSRPVARSRSRLRRGTRRGIDRELSKDWSLIAVQDEGAEAEKRR